MRVYILGAHSTGKTTLARWVSRKYGIPMITEVARAVLAEMEASLESLRTDMDLVDEYQSKVFRRQISAEMDGTFPRGFVSDRAFDNLAYAAEHSDVLSALCAGDEFQAYVTWLRLADAVFFVRPHVELLKEDGVRERANWDAVVRIDGMVKILLELNQIRYMPIESASMQERTKVIAYVLASRASKEGKKKS